MNLLEGWLAGWQRRRDFKGRSRRMEYWSFMLGNSLISWGISAVFEAAFGDEHPVIFWLNWAEFPIWLIPSIAITIRRFHDTGRSGWLLLISVVVAALGFVPVFYISFKIIQDPKVMSSIPITIYIGGCVLALAGSIYASVITLLDSQPGENKWGPNPKEQAVAA